MGLDMYLSAKKYVQDWKHTFPNRIIPEDTLAKQVAKITNAPGPVSYVQCELFYWRKANQIHNWFVKNTQDGTDDCRPSYTISRHELKELREIINQVLESPTLAHELLPRTSGFFFGSEEYNDWYFDQLRETTKMLEEILDTDKYDGWDFEYRSSW